MSDMKCPFCQQKLECMGKYTDGSSKWLCNRCGLFGDKRLFDELDRTRKALDVAVDALDVISQITNQIDVCDTANDALNTITALEQKDM